MPNSMFYILIAIVVGWYLFSAQRRKRQMLASLPEGVRGVRHGPVPGYSYLPGAGIRWDPSATPMGLSEDWEPVSLETLHAGRRSRLVLTLRARDLDSTERYNVMKTLTTRIQQRSGAKVVAAQLVSDGHTTQPEAVLVYAPDGRGWTGTAEDAVITAELPDRQPFRMST